MATLWIKRISAKNLKNVEKFGGKNHPFMTVSMGSTWRKETKVIHDGGSSVEWSSDAAESSRLLDESWKIQVSPDELRTILITVTAWAHNNVLAHKRIGEGETSISELLDSSGKEIDFTIDLLNTKKSRSHGFAVITLSCSPVEEGNHDTVQYSFSPLENDILYADSNSPEASVNGLTTDSRPRASVSSSSAPTDIEVPLPRQGSISLNRDRTMTLGAADYQGDDEIKKTFANAFIQIKKLIATDLMNVEILGGKNDPFVALSVNGKKWTRRTSTLQDAGSNAEWSIDSPDHANKLDDDLWKVDVTFEEMLRGVMTAEVSDENKFRSNVLIGADEVALRDACALASKGGGEVKLTFYLSDKKNRSTGQLLVILDVVPENSEALNSDKDDSIALTVSRFARAELAIIKIVAKGLKNVETVGENDPYVLVTFCGLRKKRTPTIHDGGSNVEWSVDATDPSMKLDDTWKFHVEWDDITESTMEVAVLDSNTYRADAEIGGGHGSLLELAAVGVRQGKIYAKIPIFDKKMKSAGMVIVYFKMLSREPAVHKPLVPSFKSGTVWIRRVSLRTIKNLEIGFENDPFSVVVGVEDPNGKSWQAQTPAAEENFEVDWSAAPSNPSRVLVTSQWKTPITRRDVMNRTLTVKLMNARLQTIIAEGAVVMSHLGHDGVMRSNMILRVTCRNKKRKICGEVYLVFRLDPPSSVGFYLTVAALIILIALIFG